MTFSDSRVIELARSFAPVWESVAPVSVAVFDLGEGRTVRGTMSGEIALYFCRPDGLVFDILPALHSPAVTAKAIAQALAFYEKTGATPQAVRDLHKERLAKLGPLDKNDPATTQSVRARLKLAERRATSDGGTRALATMAGAKTTIISPHELGVDGTVVVETRPTRYPDELFTVIEPGGYRLFARQVHEAFLAEPGLKTPAQWKERVFVKILDEKLEGGEYHYDVDSLVPMAIEDE